MISDYIAAPRDNIQHDAAGNYLDPSYFVFPGFFSDREFVTLAITF